MIPSIRKTCGEIANAVPVVYVRGNTRYLTDPQIAIVESRNPTLRGKKARARFFAARLARGLDDHKWARDWHRRRKHDGALDANGYTIARVATGLARVCPMRHRRLA